MPTLLILGGLGAVALYVWSTQSSTPPGGVYAATPPPGFQGAPGQFQATVSPGDATNPGNYPVVPNGTQPGAPAGTTSTGAPLFHTGYSSGMSGQAWVHDHMGNPYLLG